MNGFTFQWPALLVLLLLAFPLAGLLAYARRRRLAAIAAMGGGKPTHRRLRDVMRVAAFVMLVLALARPGYAPRTESMSHTGRDVVFVLDVSQSMLAEDASPSRLEVAKQAVRDALMTLGNERVGLVVYAGSASILCPLTYDYDFVRYMLEQANPRTVDFGGTALQSAVEKAADQVFMDGREGVQDLVVLTDGGDHGSTLDKMLEVIEQRKIDVLLIGIGDPNSASPIRLKDEKGAVSLLEDDGAPVYTKLEAGALRELAARSGNVEYVEAGAGPFDLGHLYQDYASGRRREAASGETGLVVYQEGAVLFLVPGLLLLLLSECWGARGPGLGSAAVICCGLLLPGSGLADEAFRASFEAAVRSFEDGSHEEAEAGFSKLYQEVAGGTADAGELAALHFNRGLCLIKLSEAQAEMAPEQALLLAEQARDSFLAAKRGAPGMRRAGVRLELTSALVAELRAKVEEQEKAKKELDDEVQALVERLQALLKAQQDLRAEVSAADVPRQQERRGPNTPPPAPVTEPEGAVGMVGEFVAKQVAVRGESDAVGERMKAIDGKLKVPVPGVLAMDTVLTEPLRLMGGTAEPLARAIEGLKVWNTWPASRFAQQQFEKILEEILDLLVSDSQQEGDEGEEMEDYEEGEEWEESDEGSSDSMAAAGDLAASAEMQPLPKPNYSAEDILMEEQGSLQFRQQKRAGENAGKVEKDY